MIDSLPMIERKAIRRWDRAKAPKYLRAEQVRAILNYEFDKRLKDETRSHNLNKYYVLFSLLWNTGARISEALYLKLDDMKNEPYKQILFRTMKKGKDASRYVPISEEMFNILSRYANEANLRGEDFLFDITKVAVHLELKRVVKAIGLPSWVHTHTFRHSFAVNCLAQGVSLPALKELLGHESIETTMVYLKVSQPDIRDQLSKVQF